MNPPEIVMVSCVDGKLHVEFPAVIKPGDAFHLFEQVRLLAEKERAGKILIDVRAYTGRLSVMQRLQIAVALAARLSKYQVAGVMSETTVDPQRLGETMAVNRGAHTKVFTNLPEAQAWLDATPAPKLKPPGRI